MKRKLLIGLTILFLIFMFFKIKDGLGNNSLITPSLITQKLAGPTPSQVPTPTLTPTPTPIILNKSSDLLEEINKLTPEDFSVDFKLLRENSSNL